HVKSAIGNQKSRNGFTLVELLVVVVIIAILLSLLAPALDKAIYQAELAVCGANLHAIGAGASIYTMDYKKVYPGVGRFTNSAAQAINDWDNSSFDLRPVIRGYMGIK